MIRKKSLIPFTLALLAGVAVLGFPCSARAAFVLTLTDNLGNTVTVVDQGAGDSNSVVGAITFIGTLTGGSGASPWNVNVTTGLSKPLAPNSGNLAHIDLNSVNASSTAGATLTISLTDTDFTLSSSGTIDHTHGIGGTVQSGTGNSLISADYLDLANNEFGLANGIHLGPFGGVFSGSGSNVIPGYVGGSPFSMTEVVVITHAVAGSTSFNAESTAVVPAPAGLALALIGAPVFGIGAWLRRRRTAVA